MRREALRALIRDPARRDDAIATGLGDSDERIVQMALGAAMQNCPPKAARVLIADGVQRSQGLTDLPQPVVVKRVHVAVA